MATLGLESVKKDFGKTTVIHGVDLQVKDGEFIVIVGPSGCGKSTLLRMVAGLETVTQGNITIDGDKVNDKEPMDRNIAMVFQNYALYPHMSVFANMAYGLKIAGFSKDVIQQKVVQAAKLLEIDGLLERKPRQLSGGQRQRVAMGRAIVRDPAIFLFDEPLSNLDAKLRVQMRLEMKSLQRKLGTTALYVTHDQIEAMTLADRIIVMNQGNVEQIGTPIDVYSKPQTLFTAQFIGSPAMIIVDGKIDDGQLSLPDGTVLDCDVPETKRAVKIGFRPEGLILDDNGPIHMTATMSEPIGASTLLHGKLKNSDDPVTASIPGVFDLSSHGQAVSFTLDADYIHLFDAENGQRIAT